MRCLDAGSKYIETLMVLKIGDGSFELKFQMNTIENDAAIQHSVFLVIESGALLMSGL